jgi:iduronate 2-sulfatase
MTNFEHGTKIPLMIGCPGGKCVGRTPALVESIDIMPTLLTEAGIAAPACPPTHAASRATNYCVEGRSLSDLLRAPTAPAALAKHSAAYSQFPRPEHPSRMIDLACRDNPKQQHGCASGECTDGCPNKMGYTVRTDTYRYTAWVIFNKCANATCPDALADWDKVVARELYNHSDAPVPVSYDMETENIAELETSQSVVAALHAQLKAFNTGFLLSEQ